LRCGFAATKACDTMHLVPWFAWQTDARGWAGWMMATLTCLAAAGCSPIPGFGCNDDAQCQRGDLQGTCEPIGFCAYPDGDCPSGRRFSPYAGSPYASECTSVEPLETSTSDTADEDSSSSTTWIPEPICGNGILEDGEECDEGDAPSGDCNRCCRRSGIRVAEHLPAKELGSNEGYDFIVLDDGDIVLVGSHAVTDQGVDALVMRVSAAGEPRWTESFHGPAHGEGEVPNLPDHARSIALAPTGDRVLVAGFLTPDTAPATMETPKVTPRSLIWLAALDVESGDPLWEHLDGDPPPSIDQGWDAMVDPLGGVVLAGRNASALTLRRYTVAKWRDDDGMSGDYEIVADWLQSISGPGGVSTGHAVLVAGERVFVGGAVRDDTDIHRHLQAFEVVGGQEPAMPCVDAGEPTGLDNDDRIYDLALAPDGHIAAAGYQYKFADEGRDAWVGWYSPEGCDLLWQRTRGGPTGQHDEARGIAVDEQGNVFAVGYMHNNDSSQDIWIAKFRPMHEMLWDTTRDGTASGNDQGWSVAVENDACELVVAGHVRSQQGRSDTWLGRYTQ
jgi:hypothetical protein